MRRERYRSQGRDEGGNEKGESQRKVELWANPAEAVNYSCPLPS